jgi:hypothetical protein
MPGILGASQLRIFTPPSGPGAYGSWAYPIKKTPMFVTLPQTPVNLRNEVRLSETPYPIWLFDYNFSYLKGAEFIPNTANNSGLAYVLGFYGASLGSAAGWLFQDPFDYSVTDELFGWGDGVTTEFQLQRSINGLFPDIIQNPNSISAIKQNGVVLPPVSGTGYYAGLENLLLQSQAFSTSPWTAYTSGGAAAPALTGGQTAPDGTTTAFQAVFPTTSGSQASFLYQDLPSILYSGQNFTFSIWMKAATASTINLIIKDAAGIYAQTSLITVGTSWTRYSISGTFPSVVIPGYDLEVSFGLPTSQAGITVDIWGAQLERQPNAGGYLVTTTSPAFPNGVVTFRVAPPIAAQLTWSGTFWFRCRFDEDEMADLKQSLWQIWDLDTLKFRSVILGDP